MACLMLTFCSDKFFGLHIVRVDIKSFIIEILSKTNMVYRMSIYALKLYCNIDSYLASSWLSYLFDPPITGRIHVQFKHLNHIGQPLFVKHVRHWFPFESEPIIGRQERETRSKEFAKYRMTELVPINVLVLSGVHILDHLRIWDIRYNHLKEFVGDHRMLLCT